jgi:hypothetical protein
MKQEINEPIRIGNLRTVGAIAVEVARLYRKARRKEIDVGFAKTLVSILMDLRTCVEAGEFEKRIAQIEELVVKAYATQQSSFKPRMVS